MTSQQPGLIYNLALRDLHAARGAAFQAFGSWSLPAAYGDPKAELSAIRSRAAVFDRSHRSRFMVTGTDAGELLARAFAGHVVELEEGRSMRTVALNPDGRIDDLVLIARTGGIAYLVSGEPGRRTITADRLDGARDEGFDVRIDDRTESTCVIGVAGPEAEASVREHLTEGLPARLQTLHCLAFEFHGFRALAIRTSDVGEDGFEFVVAPAVAHHLVETLNDAQVALAGFEALTVARVEACVPAYDPDLSPGLTPSEADIDTLLDLPPAAADRILSAVLIDGKGVAPGTPVQAGEALVGEIRSCVWSPNLDSTIGLALLQSLHAQPGASLSAGGQAVHVAAKPLYRRRPTR